MRIFVVIVQLYLVVSGTLFIYYFLSFTNWWTSNCHNALPL